MGTLKNTRSVDAWRLSLVFVVVCFGAQAGAQGTNPNDGEGLTIYVKARFFLNFSNFEFLALGEVTGPGLGFRRFLLQRQWEKRTERSAITRR